MKHHDPSTFYPLFFNMFSPSRSSSRNIFRPLPLISSRRFFPSVAPLYLSNPPFFFKISSTNFSIDSSGGEFRSRMLSCSHSSVSAPEASPSFRCLEGIRTIAETGQFKVWLLDQFGVLHDGKQPYPGAILALEKLAISGTKLVIISNSSRRASVTMDKVKSLGFNPSLFLGAITSGELTHQYLERRDDSWFAALGRSCIHLTWGDRGAISLDGLGLHVVKNVKDADFILAHGTEAIGLPSGESLSVSLEELEKVLESCARKGIPMVVANPDYVTVEVRALRVMPGTLGAKYEKLGGEVKWMGKPDKVIYRSAMTLAGVDDASTCVAVGDSLHHDILGANTAGIKSAFITGGIHATELSLQSFGEAADPIVIEALTSKYKAKPEYVLPSFTW